MPILSVPCKQSFLSCMACSVNKVIHVAMQESNLCSRGNLSEHILQQTNIGLLVGKRVKKAYPQNKNNDLVFSLGAFSDMNFFKLWLTGQLKLI